MCNSLNTFFMEKMLTSKRLQPEQIFPMAIFLPDLMDIVSFICFFHSEQVDTKNQMQTSVSSGTTTMQRNRIKMNFIAKYQQLMSFQLIYSRFQWIWMRATIQHERQVALCRRKLIEENHNYFLCFRWN